MNCAEKLLEPTIFFKPTYFSKYCDIYPLNKLLNKVALNRFRNTGHVEVPCEGCVTVVLWSIVGVVISKEKN